MEPLYLKIAKSFDPDKLKEENPGLYHGYAGLSIFYYHLFRETGNPQFEKIADNLVDKAFSNLNTLGPVDFEKGLAGIGWCMEYLIQNKFAEGNSDEILEEVDNRVFKLLNEELPSSFEIFNGLTGYLVYLIFRLRSSQSPESMARQINRELLILVVNKLYEVATPQFPYIVKDFIFDLFWRFPVILFTLSEVYKLNIYNQKIDCMIRQWHPNFEAYIPSLQINRLYMATVLMKINSQIPESKLEKQINLLLYATDFKTIINEVAPDLKSVRYGLPGFMIVLDWAVKSFTPDFPNYPELLKTRKIFKDELLELYESVKIEDFNTKQSMYGLSEGITGLGLLNILSPDLTKDI